MLHNVVALTTASDLAVLKSSTDNSKSSTDAAVTSKAEIEALLALQFSEPLPAVMKKVQKAAKTMPVSEAMNAAGHKMPHEVQSLLRARNPTDQASLRSLVATQSEISGDRHSGGLSDDSTFGKAMAFINAEYMTAREKLDLKLLECGFFKLIKEKLLYETQDSLMSLQWTWAFARQPWKIAKERSKSSKTSFIL
jgi:hypothetical protein